MANDSGYVPISGSDRQPLADAVEAGPADGQQQIHVTVVLKAPASAGPQLPPDAVSARLGQRRYLTRAELAESSAASEETVERVRLFAQEHGLTVEDVDRVRRSVTLSGPVDAFSDAFRVQLRIYRTPQLTYRGRQGPVHIPAELEGSVEAVLGLDNRPQARPHLRQPRTPAPDNGTAATSFFPPQIARFYDFPEHVDGSGQCVGILEFVTPTDPQDPGSPRGAGYRIGELQAYFAELGVSPAPEVIGVSVDGAENTPGTNPDVDVEVMLDIEVVSSIAPGAKIVVYFAPNTSRGFVDAVKAAVHDETNNPSALSISWGGPEQEAWTGQTRRSLEAAFESAARVGMTVLAAAGDDGSNDRVGDGMAHADYPASSPYVLGCGGTRITVGGDRITEEVTWDDQGAGGGGVSELFGLPSYQQGVGVPLSANRPHRAGRGVPDVAADASPLSGYRIRLNDGDEQPVGGTSAVAPLLCALVALVNEGTGTPMGFANPILYHVARIEGVFQDVTEGNNGDYQAGAGWDACTGLGSPNGSELLSALRQQ